MWLWGLIPLLLVFDVGRSNEDAKRLYDDLMVSYNRLRRPVRNPHEVLLIKMKLRLSQIIDVHEKDQIMTTSVWLKQEWMDHKLTWVPSNYGNVSVLYVPAEMIWVPDIVLYNNADSNYNITITTKATLHYDGRVLWEPPAIFKSMCPIDVQWFPFDDQECELKFGSWTFSEELLDLQHFPDQKVVQRQVWDPPSKSYINISEVYDGIDLSDYYPSVEWDILAIPSRRHGKTYPSCCPNSTAFIDISYFINLRRKPLFYTVNLIFPCVGISFLTILVFYLPSDSGEKITLCISILVALTVFFLLLTEIIPATSIVLPLIGKYLLFTMIMVSLSVMVTVIVLNLHFRTPTTHRMPWWVKTIFLKTLPKYLFMRRPMSEDESFRRISARKTDNYGLERLEATGMLFAVPAVSAVIPVMQQMNHSQEEDMGFASGYRPPLIRQNRVPSPLPKAPTSPRQRHKFEKLYYAPPVLKAFDNVCFIAELLKKKDRDDKIDEDWKYVAMVLDRLFLWIFSVTCMLGTAIILLQAPTFYDSRQPLNTYHRSESNFVEP